MQKNHTETVKVALITGAARRIGASIARMLHQHGMNVVLHYHHSAAEAKKLCAELNQQRPASAALLEADLLDDKTPGTLITQATQLWGRLDALINNAAQFFKTTVGTTTEAHWNTLLSCNLKAPFFLAQAAAPHLAAQHGCIINISDIHAERPMREHPVYCIAKAGLNMLTKTLAKELGPAIRVNAIAPGATVWPEDANELNPDLKQHIISRTALKRAGNPDEIARAVLFLVRDGNYITGQILAVDGGRLLTI